MSDARLYLLLCSADVPRSEQLRNARDLASTKRPPHHKRNGNIMKTIARVIESMLTKDATQQWTGQTSAVTPCGVWTWGGFAE